MESLGEWKAWIDVLNYASNHATLQEVNVKGVYLVTRALLPLMLKTKDSMRTVLNVSSIGANILRPGASGYQVSHEESCNFFLLF